MRSLLIVLSLLLCGSAAADPGTYSIRTTTASAQEDAELMARTGVLRHCGRNGGRREGIGFSTSGPDAAKRACCFYGKYRIVESGVAWSPVRRGWFAVNRYE